MKTQTPNRKFPWLATLLIATLISTVMVACVGRPEVARDAGPSDNEPGAGPFDNEPMLLTAFFGLDNETMPLPPNICRSGRPGQDGMPVIFSHPIDMDTLDPEDFEVTSAEGMISTPICTVPQPAVDDGENRTIVLVGEFGTAPDNEPVEVEVVGEVLSSPETGAIDFNGTTVDVIPLIDGPEIITAEVLPESLWILDREGERAVGSGCPSEGTQQVVRVRWTGGIAKPNEEEVDDLEREQYLVTIEDEDGEFEEVVPFALGNLDDGDNNHDLCLDVEGEPVSVSFPEGYVIDPNGDLNPETGAEITVLPGQTPDPTQTPQLDDGEMSDEPGLLLAQLHNGALEGADYWSDEPMILSAGLGFDNIIGLPEVNEETVREAGGSWYGSVTCTSGEEPGIAAFTTAAASNQIERAYKGYSEYDDGLPIVFSWPVASETVDPTDFQFTLNTGEIVFPNSIGMWPNWELNERNTVVAFGDFGNRGLSSEDDAVFPVRLDIVEDDTSLLLIGPGGQEFNAVGLSWETDATPYDSGPRLVGAKLNAIGDTSPGEGGIPILERGVLGAFLPNDELSLYDEGDFRIRVLTTGGFSPDGVTGLRPDMYEDFFIVHANGADGETVLLENVGEEYAVAGGTLRVVGLSDLGQGENLDAGIFYDDCYQEDRDNYIDIILVGDEAAARNITFVEIPALEGGYGAFYNPGGPGPEPFEGVRYTAPGPPDLEPVIIALDDPMRIDRAAR